MKSIALLTITLFAISCSPSLKYYTKDIHNDFRWSDSELKKIQFYISDDIYLWRDISKGESVISNGKIKIKDGREVEEIIIKSGTKGAYLFSPNKNHYAISFDANDDSKFLVFGPSDQVNGRYVLLAKDWDKRYGNVTYGKKVYRTTNSSAYAFLMVDVSKTKRTKVTATRAPGRDINN